MFQSSIFTASWYSAIYGDTSLCYVHILDNMDHVVLDMVQMH